MSIACEPEARYLGLVDHQVCLECPDRACIFCEADRSRLSMRVIVKSHPIVEAIASAQARAGYVD